MARETGTVERFMDEKGFGFIKPDSGGKDVFVHHTAIQGSGFKSLKPGTRVEYEIKQDPKGPRADNVVVAEAALASIPRQTSTGTTKFPPPTPSSPPR